MPAPCSPATAPAGRPAAAECGDGNVSSTMSGTAGGSNRLDTAGAAACYGEEDLQQSTMSSAASFIKKGARAAAHLSEQGGRVLPQLLGVAVGQEHGAAQHVLVRQVCSTWISIHVWGGGLCALTGPPLAAWKKATSKGRQPIQHRRRPRIRPGLVIHELTRDVIQCGEVLRGGRHLV